MDRTKIKMFRQFIEWMASQVDDATALEHPEAYPKWEIGKEYVKDERIRYEDVLYKVLQNHTSQADWTPDTAVSLYVRVSIEEWPEWVQPQGSHDAYSKGDRVRHGLDSQGNERHWESLIDANVYEPSESVPTLWKEIE